MTPLGFRAVPTLDERADLLRGLDLLAHLDRVSLARLAASLETVPVTAQMAVCTAGDPGDALFIVSAGSFGVFDREGRELRTLRRGDHFGELALLTGEPRSATVRALSDGELFRLERAAFTRLLEESTSAARAVATALAHVVHGDTDAAHATAAMTAPRVSRRRAYAGIGIAALLGAFALLSPVGPLRFFAILAAAIALWVTAAIPVFLTALGLVAAWVALQVAEPWQTLSGFGSFGWLFAVSVLGIAAVMGRSGLLLRIALLLSERLPPSVRWQSAAFFITGIVLTPMLPLAMGRASLTAPLALNVAEALRVRDRSRESAAIGLASWIGAGPLLFTFLTGSPVCFLAWGLMPRAVRDRTDWLTWLVATAPLALLVSVGSLVALFVLFRPGTAERPAPERLALQRTVLGPLTRSEIVIVLALLGTVAGWASTPATRFDPGVIALIGFVVIALAGRADARTLAGLDWGYLFFYGVALAIPTLVASYQLDRFLTNTVAPLVQNIPVAKPAFVVGVAGVAALLRSVLLAEHVVLVLILLLAPIAVVIGVDPFLVAVGALSMCVLWYVPGQSPEYLVAYTASEGRLYTHAQARKAAFAYAAVVLVSLVVVMPYWHGLGLL
jgi:CRP-like cAMP-binding protein